VYDTGGTCTTRGGNEYLRGMDHFGDFSVEGRIILK